MTWLIPKAVIPACVVKLSMLDSSAQPFFVGQSTALRNLEAFMIDKNKDCLVVTGPAGSG
jgi:hypothetical protein